MKKSLDYGINLLYPTPVYLSKITEEQCNIILSDCLINENLSSPRSDDTSNVINFSPTLKKLAEEKFSEYLYEVFKVDLSEYKHSFKAWLTGNQGGYFMDTHNHSGSPFVSVFYVLSEQEKVGGELVMTDPRPNANRGYFDEFIKPFSPTIFQPSTGDVIIFPGYLYHQVRPFHSKLRIAIPVDLFIPNEG
jgi:hypothetical protein